MTTNHHPDWNSSEAPSVKDRIVALNIHDTLFERIAEFPEAAIKMRFGKESALASSYVEGEVFRCGRAAYSYIRENAKPGKIIENDVEFRRVMDDLVNILLRYGLVHENSKRLNWSPSPSNVFMRMFRISNRTGPGNDGLRAANGEMTLMYRQEGEPIPFYLMAEDNEDLEPMAQFVMVWLMNPVNDWIIAPAQRFWHRMPFYPRKRLHGESDDPEAYGVDVVNSRTLSAVANALVYVIAILILLAPIATFNTIQGQTLRIAIMPFFCLVLVGAAQLMGSSTTPMFTSIQIFPGDDNLRGYERVEEFLRDDGVVLNVMDAYLARSPPVPTSKLSTRPNMDTTVSTNLICHTAPVLNDMLLQCSSLF